MQLAKIDEHTSDNMPLNYAVPQGPVLGPVLYTFYTLSITETTKPYSVGYHMYADDTQLYASGAPHRIGKVGINHRLSTNSINEEIFKQASTEYNQALERSGYNTTLQFDKGKEKTITDRTLPPEEPKKRERKITWYNPPYRKIVATKVGKTFLRLINKHFPRNNKLHKIINRNTIKISYSCLPSFKQTILNHNKRLLQKQETENSTPTSTRPCNCRKKNECPLNGKCLTECIVYKATVTQPATNKIDTYVGLTDNSFKTRYNLHKSSFKPEHKKSSTKLSEFIWKLKNNNTYHKIEWQILKKQKSYTSDMKYCTLCLQEKFEILNNAPTLNHRKELFTFCVHKKRHLLSNFAALPI
ncbi:reverse transcriptase-like protein [Elysia marginata]|uniref:Reverse transcriptase-like protein n=1 Tax=Elysia marginata TaxID=1093978 RepID=A0AAV4FPH9_9GAST|nr:reverse transcriptase-like protein [Elysia marginata]